MTPLPTRRKLKMLTMAVTATIPWFLQPAKASAYEVRHLDREVTYQCDFPLVGEQLIPTRIRTTGPETTEAGTEYEISVSAELTLEESFRQAFVDLLDSHTMALEAQMVLHQEPLGLYHTTDQSYSTTSLDFPPINADLSLPRTTLPQTPGAFNVTAHSPSIAVRAEVTPDAYGVDLINEGDLPVTLNFFREDGSQVDGLNDVQLSCTLMPSQPGELTWQPDEVDFGWVISGMNQTKTLTLYNPGPWRFISNVFLSFPADASASFIQTSDCEVLEAGESCQAEVTFSPASTGTHDAILVAKYIMSGGAGGQASARLSGVSEVSGRPELTTSPEAVNFGIVEPGERIVADITITNLSTFPADLSGITVEGEDASLFQLNQNCGNRIEPRSQCTASILFAPYNFVAATASLDIQVQGVVDPISVPISSEKPTNPCDTEVPSERVSYTGDLLFSRAEVPTDIRGELVKPRPCPELPAQGELQVDPFETQLPAVDTLFGRTQANARMNLTLNQPLNVESIGSDYLIAQGRYHLQIPEVTIEIFGIRIPWGGGAGCQTVDPVTATLNIPITPGMEVNGLLEIGPFENCGLATSILNRRLQGDSHSLTLWPHEAVEMPEIITQN